MFQFTGTVTYGDPMAISPGTTVVGSFGYDTTLQPDILSESDATYRIPPPFALSARVGNHQLTTGNLSIAVSNRTRGNVEDMMLIFGEPSVLDGTTFPQGVFAVVLASAPGKNGALGNLKLPNALSLNLFDAGVTLTYGTFQIDGGQTGTLLQFTIDSITLLGEAP